MDNLDRAIEIANSGDPDAEEQLERLAEQAEEWQRPLIMQCTEIIAVREFSDG